MSVSLACESKFVFEILDPLVMLRAGTLYLCWVLNDSRGSLAISVAQVVVVLVATNLGHKLALLSELDRICLLMI